MAVIMSVTVLEFFVFQWFLSAVILVTIFEKITGNFTTPTYMTAIGFCLLFIDSIMNPLWTTFLSQKRNRVNFSSGISHVK